MAAPESFALDEIEDIEMTEADAVLLRQLLEEFEMDIADYKRVEYDTVQSPESVDGTRVVMTGAQSSFKEESNPVHDFGWIDEITEMNSPVPSGEDPGWYLEDMGLLQFDIHDVTTEETAYSCLWDDS